MATKKKIARPKPRTKKAPQTAEQPSARDVQDAAARARENVIEALSLLGSDDDPREELCEALAALDTTIRELARLQAEVTQ